MSAHEIAAKAALLKVIGERFKDAKAALDCEITDTWRAKDRATAVLPTGDEIGAVTLVSGRTTARLADEAAFVAWVEATHPDQMETVTITRPNPDFVQRVLSAARQLGVAVDVDSETGEEIPGIAVSQGDPHPMVKLAPDAAELVAKRWQSGGLVQLVAGLLRPELPEGDPS